jgi:hypothetical protein
MSARRPSSNRSTASTNGRNTASPGRRRYPAAPGCPLAVSPAVQPATDRAASRVRAGARCSPPLRSCRAGRRPRQRASWPRRAGSARLAGAAAGAESPPGRPARSSPCSPPPTPGPAGRRPVRPAASPGTAAPTASRRPMASGRPAGARPGGRHGAACPGRRWWPPGTARSAGSTGPRSNPGSARRAGRPPARDLRPRRRTRASGSSARAVRAGTGAPGRRSLPPGDHSTGGPVSFPVRHVCMDDNDHEREP